MQMLLCCSSLGRISAVSTSMSTTSPEDLPKEAEPESTNLPM